MRTSSSRTASSNALQLASTTLSETPAVDLGKNSRFSLTDGAGPGSALCRDRATPRQSARTFAWRPMRPRRPVKIRGSVRSCTRPYPYPHQVPKVISL